MTDATLASPEGRPGPPELTTTTATVPYRVRFDECGPAGLVRTSVLLRYAQDVAWVHSEGLGYDRAWYAERGLWWLVRGVELEVLGPIRLGATVEVTTTVVGFRKVWARRRTETRDVAGTLLAWAHTDWVMTDERGAPTRVPREFEERFGAQPGRFSPTKVALPPTPAHAAEHRFAVRLADLDPMGHANNGAYLDWLEEAALEATGAATAGRLAATPRRYRLEYLAPALPGAALVAAIWPANEAGVLAYRLRDAMGTELLRADARL